LPAAFDDAPSDGETRQRFDRRMPDKMSIMLFDHFGACAADLRDREERKS
jgi:hypothetical protein